MKKNRCLAIMTVTFVAFGLSSCASAPAEAGTREYALREKGPAGGYIFYVNPNWEADGWHYLEAAPRCLEDTPIWSDPIGSVLAPDPSIGAGKANTAAIVATPGLKQSAAAICDRYVLRSFAGSFDDWFLPSKDELAAMCWNLQGVKREGDVTVRNPEVPRPFLGSFPRLFWSSTDSGPEHAWMQSIAGDDEGVQYQNAKIGPKFIWPVRRF